ncbi:prion-like-(Q/N-rich) domain-bearing protein 25 [Bombus pascuorum]|uniref:prion-like-(Q/N-rich) domain-bearing protein 25 n=1 Tax=Bombus pascuorum TaxID=65598 RepID=UPI00212E5543|nr:prion-like-(Q/N-rich) domain-bearing protein 25 [Bombus pascuorum]
MLARSRTDTRQFAAKPVPFHTKIRTSRMLAFACKKYLFALLIAVIIHSAVTEDIDPPIPCVSVQTCVDNLNITKGVTCTNGYCVCENDGQMKNCSSSNIQHNKTTGFTIFQTCKIDQNCGVNNTICNTTKSQCECRKGYVLSSSKRECLKKADALDFPCTDNIQCLAYLPNTTCQNNQCICIPGYHFVTNACYKTIDVGKSCNRSEECAHVNGVICTDRNICDCAEATVINKDKKKCLRVAEDILEECEEDVQCIESFPNASCVNRTCQCQSGYHFENTEKQCYNNKKLGETCGNTYDCYQEENGNVTEKAVICEKNVCVCAENYERKDDRCVSGGSHLLPVLPTFLVTIICFISFRLD